MRKFFRGGEISVDLSQKGGATQKRYIYIYIYIYIHTHTHTQIYRRTGRQILKQTEIWKHE